MTDHDRFVAITVREDKQLGLGEVLTITAVAKAARMDVPSARRRLDEMIRRGQAQRDPSDPDAIRLLYKRL